MDGNGLIAIGLGDCCPVGRQEVGYKSPLVFTDSVVTMDMAEKSAFIFQTLGMNLQRDFAAALAARLRIIRRLDFPDAPAYNGKHRSGWTISWPANRAISLRNGDIMDKQRIQAAVREILLAIGEDPDREGLRETPRRVADMYGELFSGLEEDPRDHLKIFQEDQHDEMVTVRDIPLHSMCEHHLVPFTGVAHIAYIPRDGRVIGLSKLARIVTAFARRPQLQERLTAQVADFLETELNPQGVAVIIEAEHLCMTMRGARAAGSRTQTSALRGRMKSDARTRAETLALLTGR